MTSPFARPAAPAATLAIDTTPPRVGTTTAPSTQPTTAPAGGRFATKRERPDQYPGAADLMPKSIKGADGGLVIIRVERVERDLPGSNDSKYDRFHTQTWILDAPNGLPEHIITAGSEVDGAYHLPEMAWSGAGLVRDLEQPLRDRQLFLGRVSSYRNQFGKPSPEFLDVLSEADVAAAEMWLERHPEADFPKATFAQAAR